MGHSDIATITTMKKALRRLKGFISSKRDFIIPCLIVIPLIAYSLRSSAESINPLFNFSLTNLGLVGLALYAVLKKPWKENLAGHFKKAYRQQLKSIQKSMKERDALREEVDTLSIFHRNYSSLEEVGKAMCEEAGFPFVGDMGKRLWEGNRESLKKGLDEIEHIKNSEDAEKILRNYSQMEYISRDLLEEVMTLRELKSRSKVGEISGTVMFTEEFAKDFPEKQDLTFLFGLNQNT